MDSKSTESFNAAFALLDASGKERVTLALIKDFVTSTGAKIGDPSVVTTLFNELDKDKSGELDSASFLTLCKKLESMTSVSVKTLVDRYVEVEYRRLFALVVDVDGSGGTPGPVTPPGKEPKIHKEEFRRFIGDCERVLSVSIADVSLLLRDFPESLDFRCFAELIARVIRNTPISVIIKSFTEATQRRRENRQLALSRFQGVTNKIAVTNRFRSNSVTKGPPKGLDDIFEDAFQLLDSRGGGVVSLDAVYEFCESFPNPPPQSTIRKIYNQFDADGSGDIDRDEFQAFCKGLEQAVSITMGDMCTFFTQAMFKRLYELVDEEGDGNDTVSKEELRQLLEAIRPALSSKLTGQEIYAVIREQEGDLNFDDFCHVIGRLTAGVPISKVVTVFEQQLRKRRAAKRKALQQFESGVFTRERSVSQFTGTTSFVKNLSEVELSDKPFCLECAEKDDMIKRLQSELERMRSENQHLKEAIDSEHRSLSATSVLRDDELQGDIVAELHVPLDAKHSAIHRKYPRLTQPAIAFTGAARLLQIATVFQENFRRSSVDVDGIAKQINNNIQQLIAVQKQLQLLGDALLEPLAQSCQAQTALVAKVDHFQRGESACDFATLLEATLRSRTAIRELAPDIECILDMSLQERRQLSHLVFVAASSSGTALPLVTLVVSTEQATQRLCDFFTLALRLGSDQLSDAEIYAKRIVAKAITSMSTGDVDRLREATAKVVQVLSISSWSSIANQVSDSLNNIRKLMTTISLSKREKAVMTMAESDVSLQLQGSKRGDPNATSTKDFADVLERSTSPRVRTRREKPRDMLAHVDALLGHYKRPEAGVQLPTNFSRVDPTGNVFHFGTKKIEVGSVEKYLTVKVGGGYLLLEEFCQRYSASEARKLDNFLCAPGVGRIGGGSGGSMMHSSVATPRTILGGMSPRTAGGTTPRGGSMPSSARSPQSAVPPIRRF